MSVINSFNTGHYDNDFLKNTIIRIGALELLANIDSGRITANDIDPFPHQLALKQYMKENANRIKRLLIADEVGLGKTIEIGLVLRDILIARGTLGQFRCLYLTKGGLLEDVHFKLKSVMSGSVNNQQIVQIEKCFTEYGKNNIDGIHVASIDAARLYVEEKKKLTQECVNPDILIIDECHHCASDGELNSEKKVEKKDTTKTYQAAYQMIRGKFWPKSKPPSLVVFMSATPFRSKPQFINLLRLLTHEILTDQNSVKFNAFLPNVTESELQTQLRSEHSPAAVIWRQQENIFNWSGGRLFPNLNIERPALKNISQEYLELIETIPETVKKICSNHGQKFGGLAVSQLDKRLTSSTLAGACWIFRWCVRHSKWNTKAMFNQDKSDGTENLRRLIKEISQKLADYNKKEKDHETVEFPSDDFKFEAKKISQRGQIDEIYDFSEKLNKNDDEGSGFDAYPEEVIELTSLGLNLLKLADNDDNTENCKLEWLKSMLEEDPKSRFLVFTESLQTCEIITKVLPKESEKLTGSLDSNARKQAVNRFCTKSHVRILVATSAADEGFDFQVANKVVHWDLSPSPAVLMQRNGRVARLGQVSDVTAYYLIIPGTHEEKRENALHERFQELGIKDERLRLKILGSLSSEEEEKISDAIKANAGNDQVQLIDEVLKKAKKENEEMEKQLKKIQGRIEEKSVIDRNKLAKRLETWQKLELPTTDGYEFNLKFNNVSWERPIFSDVTTTEKADAKIATIRRKKVTFDPEFKLFCNDGKTYSLAGLCPWTTKEIEDAKGHRPIEGIDPIGELACHLARQKYADFTTISKTSLSDFTDLNETSYLLFATHPLLEAEIESQMNTRSYLTFYAFDSNIQEPLNSEGACAESVYKIIHLLEEEALRSKPVNMSPIMLEQAKIAAEKIASWLEKKRQLPARGRENYFLPIPVALVAILP